MNPIPVSYIKNQLINSINDNKESYEVISKIKQCEIEEKKISTLKLDKSYSDIIKKHLDKKLESSKKVRNTHYEAIQSIKSHFNYHQFSDKCCDKIHKLVNNYIQEFIELILKHNYEKKEPITLKSISKEYLINSKYYSLYNLSSELIDKDNETESETDHSLMSKVQSLIKKIRDSNEDYKTVKFGKDFKILCSKMVDELLDYVFLFVKNISKFFNKKTITKEVITLSMKLILLKNSSTGQIVDVDSEFNDLFE
jgi:hypothetical protein